MTALQWFSAYVNAVDFAACLLKCQTPLQADRYAARTSAAYEMVKGPAYWESVQNQAGLLLAGVQTLRGEAA